MSHVRNVLILVLVLAVAGVAVLAFIPGIMMIGGWSGMMGRGMMGGTQWGFGLGLGRVIAGGLVSLLFLGLIVVGIYYMLSDRRTSVPEERSLQILRERFAKGEIDEPQFKKMKELLRA
ncbi:MAG: hypothetical protein V1857_01690 [archaeon]